jgi:hypothetical protein
VAEIDHRLHDDVAIIVAFQSIDERPIDLQTANREGAQMRERGIAGAKVVDLDHDARRVQAI